MVLSSLSDIGIGISYLSPPFLLFSTLFNNEQESQHKAASQSPEGETERKKEDDDLK
jgi:hypothetical protein